MNDLELDGFKAQLLDLRRDIEALTDISDAAASVVELDQSKVGRLSRMDAMQAQAMGQATVARRTRQLKDIEFALKRIDAKDYGDCAQCDEAINVQRLAFDPTSQLCITCAEASEID